MEWEEINKEILTEWNRKKICDNILKNVTIVFHDFIFQIICEGNLYNNILWRCWY